MLETKEDRYLKLNAWFIILGILKDGYPASRSMDGYATLDSITDIDALGNSPVLHRRSFPINATHSRICINFNLDTQPGVS